MISRWFTDKGDVEGLRWLRTRCDTVWAKEEEITVSISGMVRVRQGIRKAHLVNLVLAEPEVLQHALEFSLLLIVLGTCNSRHLSRRPTYKNLDVRT